MNYKDIILITILFLLAFSVWTLPFQENPLPFSEGDGAWHFSNGDPQYQQDRSTTKMPYYIGIWYYSLSKLGPFAPEYPPPNHLNYALMQIVGGDRIMSVFIYIAITCFLGIFSTYFIIRKLYGTVPAFIAGFGLIYSLREIMLYLWGQRPTMVSFVFIPLIMYTLYKYIDGFYTDKGGDKHKPIYLYLFLLLVASQYLLHIQGSVVTFFSSLAFTVIMVIKYRKLPVSKKNLRHLIISGIVFLIIILPFAPIYYGLGSEEANKTGFSRLFSWAPLDGTYTGSYPPSYVGLDNHYDFWLLALVVIGIILLIYRRENRDLLLLGWLVGIYITFHMDVFLGTSAPRIIRMMVAEPPVFFSIIGVGAVSLVNFLPLKKQMKTIAKVVFAILVVLLIFQVKSPETMNTLKTGYQGLGRITPAQYELGQWIFQSDIAEDAFFYDLGTITYPKTRWIMAVGARHINQWYGTPRNETYLTGPEYFIMDYSDLAYLASNDQYKNQILGMQQFEQKNFGGQEPIYNKDNIRVYEVKGELEEVA